MSPGTDVERDVRALVATVLKLPVTPDAPVARNACAAWDSLKHVEIVFALEDRFNVQFNATAVRSRTPSSRAMRSSYPGAAVGSTASPRQPGLDLPGPPT